MFAILNSLSASKRCLVAVCLTLGLALSLAFSMTWVAKASTTFIVTTAADNGDNVNPTPGSLRAAILGANSTAGTDGISFAIGSGLQTIQPTAQLPTITEAVIIDGTTQPGFAGAPLIELDGSMTTGKQALIVNSTGPTTIRGLIINRFGSGAITLSGGGGHLVAGNYIGTDNTGTAVLPNPNNGVGISITSPNNTIGGLTPADRNVVSGNRVQNGSLGIDVFGGNAVGNKIIGNYIGTDVTGMFSLGQVNSGIRLANAHGNIVGGATVAERNVISGNFVNVDVVSSYDNKIQGNYLGATANGSGGLTGQYGVFIEVDSHDNLFGGVNAGEGNLIPSNISRGFVVTGASPNNAILGNSITASSISIDLGFNGVTANDNGATPSDPSDADTGPNNLQNFPVLNSVAANGSNTVVEGTLRSEASKTYRIELFSNTACNGSGFGGGRFFVAATNTSTDATGNANFNFTIPTASITGIIFTATATDPANNTSELSQCKSTAAAAAGTIQFGSASLIVNESTGQAVATVTRTGGSAGAVSVHYATSNGAAPTADPVGDYTAKSGQLDFADGETAKTITIVLTNDSVSEPTEDFNITLSAPTGGAVLGPQQVINVVIGDDDTPTIAINDVQVAEGNSGTTNATFTISLQRPTFQVVTVNYATDTIGTATSGGDYQATAGTVTFAIGETSKPVTVLINGDTTPEPNETFVVKLSNNSGVAIGDFSGTGTILDDDGPANAVQFNQSSYSVQEDQTSVAITVTRSGDTSSAATVDYATADKTAGQLTDYTIAIGTLRFAAGEVSKTFVVLVNEDNYVEGNEQFDVTLSNPTGGVTLGAPATTTVTILDDAQEPSLNPIDNAQNFVSQQYHDFLNREPDPGGLAFWTGEINSCGADAACLNIKRTNVSAAFFLSIEFQQTGYLVERLYKASYGNLPGAPVPVLFTEFVRDTRAISQGVVVGQAGWEQVLDDNKQALAADFVRRARFATAYPTSMTPAQFVDAMFAKAAVVPTPAERLAAISEFNGALDTSEYAGRSRALRRVAENATFVQQEFNRAFVLMQYFGYLRRDPNVAPEAGLNYDGYNFWLSKLNQFNGNYNDAEMVRAFIASAEYRQRFGF